MSRRLTLALALLAVFCIGISSCAPAAVPTAAPTSTKAPETAKPAVAATSGAKPAATTAPASATPAAGANWKQEWDQLVAAAEKEGKVVVVGGKGELYRNAAMGFQKAYPNIRLEYTGLDGPEIAPRIMAEQQGGEYLWDLYFGGSTTGVTVFKPNGVIDPLKPILLLPEVLDDSKWQGGFDDGWVDREHQFVFHFEGGLTFVAWVNRDLAPSSELSAIDQLLDPKWKGQIITVDPRAAGPGGQTSGYLLVVKGEDWLRKYFSQDLVVVKDGRQQVEAVVRGRYPVATGVDRANVEFFKQQGLGQNVEPLAPNTVEGARISSGIGNLTLINRAPHPNAARVFANWLLSQAGQRAYSEATGLNVRRLDVPAPDLYAPNPNIKYPSIDKEEYKPSVQKAIDIAKEMIK